MTVDGAPVYNEGQKTLAMAAPDGDRARRMTFQMPEVDKALGSVSTIVANGDRVVFDAIFKACGQEIGFGFVEIMECTCWIFVAHPDKSTTSTFPRQS